MANDAPHRVPAGGAAAGSPGAALREGRGEAETEGVAVAAMSTGRALKSGAGSVAEADARLAPRLDRARLEAIAGELPGDWADAGAYAEHLAARLEDREGFVEEAEDARG